MDLFSISDEFLIDLGLTLLKIGFILAVTVGFFAPILTWVERKQSAIMQDRIGANRADIMGFTALGLFHIMADGLKMFTKEDFIQVFATRDKNIADKTAKAITSLFQQSAVSQKKHNIYKVQVGPFKEQTKLDNVLQQLKKNGYPGAFKVSL